MLRGNQHAFTFHSKHLNVNMFGGMEYESGASLDFDRGGCSCLRYICSSSMMEQVHFKFDFIVSFTRVEEHCLGLILWPMHNVVVRHGVELGPKGTKGAGCGLNMLLGIHSQYKNRKIYT